jgi:hypothetical protein
MMMMMMMMMLVVVVVVVMVMVLAMMTLKATRSRLWLIRGQCARGGGAWTWSFRPTPSSTWGRCTACSHSAAPPSSSEGSSASRSVIQS